MNYKRGVCTFCGTGCGHLLKLDDGKVVGVVPSENHPVSKGRLCVRGWNIHEVLRTDARIKSPLVKKDGKFQKVSYDEAISLVVENLSSKVSNPAEEIAFLGSPRASNEENYLFMKLARSVFKTNNISLDSESGHRNSISVLSEGTGMAGMTGSLEEIGDSDYIFVLGIDITTQNPIIGSEIHKACLSGTEVVTVSSKQTQMAKLSSQYLQLRPGTKKIILAAMAKTIVDENLADKDFIEKNAEGYEAFAASLSSLDDQEIEARTGLDPEEVRKAARNLASANSAMAFFPSGISGLDSDTISYLFNLFLMTGNLGKKGSGVNPVTGISNLQGGYDMGVAPDLLTGFQSVKDSAVVKKFNKAWNTELDGEPGRFVYDLLADEKSKVKCLVAVDHDDSIVRNPQRLNELDFIVYIGAFENSFSEYADVVIPISSYIETEGTFTNTERRIQLSPQKAETPEGIMPGWKLYTAFAEKASVAWDYSSPSDIMKEIASLTPAYQGVTYEKLDCNSGIKWPCNDKNPEGSARLDIENAGRKMKFVSVSGKFNLESSNEKYPHLLMIGKGRDYWLRNNLMKNTFIPLREYRATLLLYPGGYVEICKEDAKTIGVRDKWKVNVTSSFGSMAIDVKVSEDVRPGTAYIPYFIQHMITEFLLDRQEILRKGEDAIIPVRIEKV